MSDLREVIRSRWAFYSLILVATCVALAKIFLTWSSAHYLITSADGGYYYDLVDNLVAGRGFVTNISPFHHGLPHFPYPSIVYPLWPLVAATFARFFGLTFATFYLPALFYFLAVWLAFVVGRRYYPRTLFETGGVRFHAGHLVAIGLASNRGFYVFTSRPYTEGFAFCLFLSACWVAYDFFRRPGLANTIVLGLLTAAGALARSQLILVFVALVSTSGLLVCISPKKHWRYAPAALGLTLIAGACFYPYLRWLGQPALRANFRHYLSFSSYAYQPGLLPTVEQSAVRSLSESLCLYGEGILTAFTPWARYSYFEMYTCYSFALPLLACWWGYYSITNPRGTLALVKGRVIEHVQGLRDNSLGPALFASCFALGSLLSVHLIHLDSPEHEWLFSSRHSIPVLFSFAAALGILLRMQGIAGITGQLLLLAILISGAIQLGDTTQRTAERNATWMPEHGDVVDWINSHSGPGNVPVIVTHLPHGKQLRPHTPHAAYHALDYLDTPAVAQVMFDQLHSDYLILWVEQGEFVDQAEMTFARHATPSRVPGFRKIAELTHAIVYERDRESSALTQKKELSVLLAQAPSTCRR